MRQMESSSSPLNQAATGSLPTAKNREFRNNSGEQAGLWQPPRGFTVIEFLVVISIILVIISLLLPAILEARGAARRTHCQNNLKQLNLGLHNYTLLHKVFPPGVVNDEGPIVNEADGYHHNWIVQILPHFDSAQLFQQIDFTSGVYSPHNLRIAETPLPSLNCPSNRVQTGDKIRHSSYAACHHDREAPIDMHNVGVFTRNSSTRLESITDGASHTIFLGEVRLPDTKFAIDLTRRGAAGLLGWTSGTRATLRNASGLNQEILLDADFDNANTGPVGGFGSYHEGGAYFAWGDGSVRFVHESIDMSLLQKLAHPADGEMLSPIE